MPRTGKPLSRAEAERTVKIVEAAPTIAQAAEQLGLNGSRAVYARLESIKSKFGIAVRRADGRRKADPEPPATIQFPDFPDEDIPVEQIIELQAERFKKRQASFDAHTWFPIKVKDSRPIGIVWFGDWPDAVAISGTALIIAAGLWLWYGGRAGGQEGKS